MGDEPVALEAADQIAVRRTVRAVAGPPPAAGHRAYGELTHSPAQGVLEIGVRMSGKDHRIGIAGNKFHGIEEVLHIVALALLLHRRETLGGYWNMETEQHHLVLWHIAQVTAQPFQLLIAESGAVVARLLQAFETDVVHRNDMHVSPVPGIIHRTEDGLEHPVAAQGRSRIDFVHHTRGKLEIVVADGLEHRHTGLVGSHFLAYDWQEVVGIAPALRVGDVAEGDGITVPLLLAGICLHVRDALGLQPVHVQSILALRVAYEEEIEGLLLLAHFLKHEVIAETLVIQLAVEARMALAQRHLVAGRKGYEHPVGSRGADEAVASVLIGDGDAVIVGNHYSRDGMSLGITYLAADVETRVGSLGGGYARRKGETESETQEKTAELSHCCSSSYALALALNMVRSIRAAAIDTTIMVTKTRFHPQCSAMKPKITPDTMVLA